MKHTKQFGLGRVARPYRRKMGRLIRQERKTIELLEQNAARIDELRERLSELEKKLQ